MAVVAPGTCALEEVCGEPDRVLCLPVKPLGTAAEDFRNLHFIAGLDTEPTMFINVVDERALQQTRSSCVPRGS